MNPTAWELFQDATLSLARAGSLKERLNDAYQNHLSRIVEAELPKDLRDDFKAFSQRLTREPPLLRGEDSVRATIRKMSNGEAEAAATSVVRMFCALHRGAGPTRSASTATVVPLYIATEPRAAEG
jgi:uncharacterized protein YcsI (UPF0317 family)